MSPTRRQDRLDKARSTSEEPGAWEGERMHGSLVRAALAVEAAFPLVSAVLLGLASAASFLRGVRLAG